MGTTFNESLTRTLNDLRAIQNQKDIDGDGFERQSPPWGVITSHDSISISYVMCLNLLLLIEAVVFFPIASAVITRLLRIEVLASSELLAAIVAVQESERQLVLFSVLDVRWQGLGEIAVTSTVGSLSPCKPLPRRCGNSWTTSALSLEPLPRCCW
jgi:hypothetical protein